MSSATTCRLSVMREDASTTVAIIAGDGTELATTPVRAGHHELILVDAIMRLQLVARRGGCRVRLTGVDERLSGLLELLGLTCVLELEARREPELREQLRIQEVMQAGDSLA
jgi:hypothetical protein